MRPPPPAALRLDPAECRRLLDPTTYLEGVPFELFAKLRRERPVIWVEEPAIGDLSAGPGFWFVTGHRDVQTVLGDPGSYSSSLGGTQTRDPSTPEALRYVRRMMLNMDPPEHTRLRRLLTRSFTPRAVAQLEDRIRGHARALVARATGGRSAGRLDFVKDLAADLPLLTLAEILGVPTEDRLLLFDWSNRVIGFQDAEYATSAVFDGGSGTAMAREALRRRPRPDPSGRMPDPRTREGMPDLYHYAHLLAESKRRTPGDDVMSILLAERDDEGGSLSVEEFENMFWLFAVAGNETLRNGLPGAAIGLMEYPAEQRRLRGQPELLASAMDELLRWWTPVMTFRRTAAGDATLAGTSIRAGDKMVVSFSSANRDETVFERPDALRLDRQPNPHLAFGYGPHYCLGAHLARVQMRALFAEVFERMGTIEPDGPPALLRSNFQRGVKRLPIRWSRGR